MVLKNDDAKVAESYAGLAREGVPDIGIGSASVRNYDDHAQAAEKLAVHITNGHSAASIF